MPSAPSRAAEEATRRRKLLLAACNFMRMVYLAVLLYASPLSWKQAYHTSALTGEAWVQELIIGHPERIKNELGMHLHVFLAFVSQLRVVGGLSDSRYVTLQEQAAIFLYTCVTGLSLRHVGERFQWSTDTISKYFRRILMTVSSPPFYTFYVRLPSTHDPVPPLIRNNPKWFPFFAGAVGSMDGTHINCCPNAEDRQASHNRKGGITMNCLACCSQDMRFLYILSGWEGSAADAAVYLDARLSDLNIPDGKYYLADAGFGSCDACLVPFRGFRYHLAEWGRADVRPACKEELYNLRHASARNVVEHIFGVVKKRWAILNNPPELDIELQARILPGLAAIHNLILKHDPTDLEDFDGVHDPQPGYVEDFGSLAAGPTPPREKARADRRRDGIAQQMWDSYQALLRERGEEFANE